MSLVAFEGFDNYSTVASDPLNRRASGLQWVNWGASLVPGRVGGLAANVGQNGAFAGTLTTPQVSGIVGFAMLIDTLGSNPSMQFTDNTAGVNPQITAVFNLSRAAIDIRVGGTSGGIIASTGNNTLTPYTWNYVEISCTIDGSAGAVEVAINGQIVLNATGLNTKATANAFFSGVNFVGGSAPTNNHMSIDDIYIADSVAGAGAFAFNTFAGDIRVVTLHPIANGTTIQWTPLANANWQEVAETRNDGDVSYNSTATVGAEDLFNFAALPSTIASIMAVQITGSYRKDDSGTRIVTQQLKSGATQVAGAPVSIPLNYVYLNDLFVLDPNTSDNWTIGGVNAIAAGYVLSA